MFMHMDDDNFLSQKSLNGIYLGLVFRAVFRHYMQRSKT